MTRLDYDRYLLPVAVGESGAPEQASASGRRLQSVEDAVRRLPPLPKMMTELLRELGSADADIAQLEHRISKDPTLATRLLRMANSAFYSPRAEVCAVAHALMILGLQTARNLVLATAIRAVIGAAWTVPGFTESGIFRHSVATAVTCGRLGRAVPVLEPHADLLFVAGLLHDIGMVVLSSEYARERHAFEARGGVRPELEQAILGIDHLAAGRMVWEHWRLPNELLAPLERHHEGPQALAGEPVTLAVALADEHADIQGYGLPEPRGDPDRRTACAAALGVTVEDADHALQDLEREVKGYMGSLA